MVSPIVSSREPHRDILGGNFPTNVRDEGSVHMTSTHDDIYPIYNRSYTRDMKKKEERKGKEKNASAWGEGGETGL